MIEEFFRFSCVLRQGASIGYNTVLVTACQQNSDCGRIRFMDITILAPESIKIKGKLASFIIQAGAVKGKNQADAIIFFDRNPLDSSFAEGVRLAMSGPGEYEIAGVKVGGTKNTDTTVYYLSIDSMVVLAGKASGIKGKDSLRDSDVACVYADSVVDTSALASLGAHVVIFYGPQAKENVAALGKEAVASAKYTIARDKLPVDLEVVLLA